MFSDYKSLVIADYQKKKDQNTLSFRLQRPTPSSLKEECLAVCSERYLKKDERALREFFGQADDKAACLKSIQRFDTTKLKPLSNFLKKPTKGTHDKNIHLLAWLIDFEPRPFEFGRKYDLNTLAHHENISVETRAGDGPTFVMQEPPTVQEAAVDKLPDTTVQHSRPENRSRVGMLFGIVAVSIGIVGYLIWNNRNPVPLLIGTQECMYWAGDHYQQVPCNKKFGDTMVIALDSGMLVHFKKITATDTITTRAKGTVWYAKVNHGIEFYTSDGYHPLDRKLRLKPITDYIINKYLPPTEHR